MAKLLLPLVPVNCAACHAHQQQQRQQRLQGIMPLIFDMRKHMMSLCQRNSPSLFLPICFSLSLSSLPPLFPSFSLSCTCLCFRLRVDFQSEAAFGVFPGFVFIFSAKVAPMLHSAFSLCCLCNYPHSINCCASYCRTATPPAAHLKRFCLSS